MLQYSTCSLTITITATSISLVYHKGLSISSSTQDRDKGFEAPQPHPQLMSKVFGMLPPHAAAATTRGYSRTHTQTTSTGCSMLADAPESGSAVLVVFRQLHALELGAGGLPEGLHNLGERHLTCPGPHTITSNTRPDCGEANMPMSERLSWSVITIQPLQLLLFLSSSRDLLQKFAS